MIAFRADDGEVIWSKRIAGDPGPLALSDDGSILYVGLRSEAAVVRLNVSTRQIDLRFATDVLLYSDRRYALEIAIAPESPETVVVALFDGSHHDYAEQGILVLFDGGAPSVPDYEDQILASSIHMTSSSEFFAVNQDHELGTFSIDAGGITQTDTTPFRIHGQATGGDGLLVSSSGRVIDLATKKPLAHIAATGVPPTVSNTTLHFYDPFLRELRAWDRSSFTLIGEGRPVTVPGQLLGLIDTPAGVYGWATEGALRPRFAPPARRWPRLNEAVLHPATGVIYATSTADSNAAPNSILAIDPADDSVIWSAWLGSEPDALAVTADGSAAYVELAGSSEVVRFDLASKTVDLRFSLGSDARDGPRIANDIEVVPGDNDLLAVASGRGGEGSTDHRVTVYDSGVARPRVHNASPSAREIEVASAGRLFGYEQYLLYVMDIEADGLRQTARHRVDINGWETRIRLVGAEIWGSDGVVVHGESGDVRARLESLWPRTFSHVTPSAFRDQVALVATRGGKEPLVVIYDADTYKEVAREDAMTPAGHIRGVVLTDHGPFLWTTEGFGRASANPPPRYDGSVRGRVADAYTGGSIRHACVALFDDRYLYETTADLSGRWTVTVAPGDYYMLVIDCASRTHFSEFHDNVPVLSWEPADTVRVRAGDDPYIDTALSPVFYDLQSSQTFWYDIFWLRDTGITTGCDVAFFCPKDAVTREQMAAFVARFWRYTGNTCPGGPMPFSDVTSRSFAYRDVICIFGLDITTGTSPTTYSPNGTVSREQMAAFVARLWRALGGTCPEGDHPFLDVVSSFAVDDIACIFQLGITTGTSATTYSPKDPVTREQMAAFLSRLDQLSPEVGDLSTRLPLGIGLLSPR